MLALSGVELLPRHVSAVLVTPDADLSRGVWLGDVNARLGERGVVWGYDGSGAYRTARDAADSLAVYRIDGPGARQRFDVARAIARDPRPTKAVPLTVRLWWRCTICRRRFDLFGTDHADIHDRRVAGEAALGHLESHGVRIDSLDEAVGLLEPAGRARHINRPQLLRPIDAHDRFSR